MMYLIAMALGVVALGNFNEGREGLGIACLALGVLALVIARE